MFGFDVNKYLKRINFPGATSEMPLSKETLNMLQTAHFMSVPYENFDMVDGKDINLDTDYLFEKIIVNKRGGCSFELNGLFGDLLRSMDFGVSEHLARNLFDEVNIPMRDHRVLEVQAKDGVYVCDVGLSVESPRCALKLEEEVIQSDGFSEYKFEREPFLGWVLWQRRKMTEWKKFYAFSDEIQLSVDFLQPYFYHAKSPDSKYNKEYSAAIRTKNGMVTLNGKIIRISSTDQETKTCEISNDSEIDTYLKEYFGIYR